MKSCFLQARCLSAWQGGLAGLEGLLPAPPPLRRPPGEQGQKDRFSYGHVFFWEGKLGWEVGSERSVGPRGADGGRVSFWSTRSGSTAPGC